MLGILQQLRQQPRAAADKLVQHLRAHVALIGSISTPLVLISQISRSGGTWLNQLFDHHPQVWAHPAELKICYPDNWTWPDLSAAKSPEEVWKILSHAKLDSKFSGGSYSKGVEPGLPMIFSAETQRALFFSLSEEVSPQSERDWLNLYFTAFFFSWLDYQRRYEGKRCITAFAPMLALFPETMAAFQRAYPDGHLISIIREPVGWYASVKKRRSPDKAPREREKAKRHYGGFDQAEAAYLDNVEAMRANAQRFDARFIGLDYAGLVANTERNMRALAERLGLDFHSTMTRQTFNGMPINPNTSFADKSERSSVLSAEEAARIADGPMMQAYRSIQEICICRGE